MCQQPDLAIDLEALLEERLQLLLEVREAQQHHLRELAVLELVYRIDILCCIAIDLAIDR